MSCSCNSGTQGKTLLPMAPTGCCCSPKPGPSSQTSGQTTQAPAAKVNRLHYFGVGAAALVLWLAVYFRIDVFAAWFSFDVLALGKDTPLGAAVEFFLYDTAKILLLLVIMVYGIAWLRAGMNTERVRDYLAGRGRGIGYFLGAGFGAITPFCSCSSIPLFLGFTMARIPVGITMAFLITSPLINEIAVVLLWALLGWKFTAIYVLVGMAAGILGGIIMDALHAERWLQPFLLDALKATMASRLPVGRACSGPPALRSAIFSRGRKLRAFAAGCGNGSSWALPWAQPCTAMCRNSGSAKIWGQGNGGLCPWPLRWAFPSTPM